MEEHLRQRIQVRRARFALFSLAGLAAMMLSGMLLAQTGSGSLAGVPASAYKGSVTAGQSTGAVLPLTLDEAIQRGLKQNLGVILQGQNEHSAGGQRLQQLQALLPTINGSLRQSVTQVNLRAQGLRFPGLPAIIGPFGVQDARASLTQALVNVQALDDYLASKHNFEAAKFSVEDARDLVVLSVGNAYLTCIADAARIESVKAQLATSKISQDQAVANHEAGTSQCRRRPIPLKLASV